MNKKNSDTSSQQDNTTNQQRNVIKIKIRTPFKIELCIRELLNRSEAGLMELEALGAYGETVLHTIIPTLANYKGLVFKQEPEQHIHRHGGTAYFTRYSLLNDTETRKAQALLACYENKRGAANHDTLEDANNE